MSCQWCTYFVCSDSIGVNESVVGECRRYPKKEMVRSDYFCGEIVVRRSYPADENLIQGFFERMHEFSKEANAERSKRIALEKKIKKARKEQKQ